MIATGRGSEHEIPTDASLKNNTSHFSSNHLQFSTLTEIITAVMLQDTQTIRHYQRLTDSFVEQWNRGYRTDDIRMYLDGYLAALRNSNVIEPFLVHRLEEEATRYLYDISNFAVAQPEPEPELDYF